MLLRMEKVSRGLPEGAGQRAARIARVGARYGFGFVLGGRFASRRRADPRRVGTRLRLSFEELGPNFAELARFLAARRDLLPPYVAEELEQASTTVPAIPFADVRASVERGIGNTLERLFVRFEETPRRVGAFTQAHAVVLPGERPALLVLTRPGVRRDLLAMRPVADLTRRRLGERLPLDPSEAVAEFASHATHRRDMFFAAQVSRRLADVEDLDLRIPAVYRDYSAAHLVTFEAPQEAMAAGTFSKPVENSLLYRGVADALIRLSIREGIFLADVVPERFAAADGELWLLDPTEAFTLDPERLRGVAEVLAAVRRDDVDAVARALPLTGGAVPRDAAVLRRELRDTLGSLGGPLWREHSLTEMRNSGMEAARRGGTRLQDEVAQLLRSLVAAERFGRLGDADYRGSVVAAEAAGDLIRRYRDPAYLAARAARRLAQPDAYADYPRQVHALLGELKDGEVEVRFRHEGLDDLISKVDILANRLVFAVLVAALIVGSSMLGIFVPSGARLLGVSVFGLAGFVIAAVLGLLLLIGIIRSGRL
jgi:ubiquinone biosynthesis protein